MWRPGHGKTLRGRVLRRLQGVLQTECAEEARLQLPVLSELHGGQGQEEPVSPLQAEEVLQGGHEEGRRAERAGQNQQESALTGGDHDRP